MNPESQAVDKASIQIELEATRQAFHRLLHSIPETVWKSKGIDSAWTVKEEMWHIAWGMQFMLNVIKNAQHGIGVPNLPMSIANPLNALYSKLRSALATRQSIAKRYDKTHTAVLKALEELPDTDWDKSVKIFGETHTIEYFFHGISHHFEEHTARIRPLIPVETPNPGQ